MSGDPEGEYFSDGITEEIINALAKISALRVTSRTSSFSFKNKNIPIPQIGKELKVNIILEGSIRFSKEKVRVTAQLIDVANDFHFWSETFDRSMNNIFEVQDEISLHIADKLREHLGHFEISEHLVENQNISLNDYKEYLKGRYYLMKLDKANTLKAIEIFKGITKTAPDFPKAYLDINQGYTYLGTMGLLPSYEAFTSAQPYLEKAIELGPNLPGTQLNLSWINFYQKWDIPNAIEHIQNAIDIRPSDEMYLTYSNFKAVLGDFDGALALVNKAIQMAPLSSTNTNFKGFIYYLKEDYGKALPYFKESLKLQEDLPFPILYIGLCNLFLGNENEAIKYFTNLPDTANSDLAKLGGLTLCHAYINNIKEVKEGIAKLKEAQNTSAMGSATNFLILTYAVLNDLDSALGLIRESMDNRLPILLLLKTDPNIKLLKNHPDFIVMMNKIFGESSEDVPKERTKYKKALISNTEKIKYQKSLDALMDAEQPFLNPKISLRGLAKLVAIHPNQLSQLLNEQYDQNFSEFINSRRVDYFKEELIKPENKNLTLLALAYDSGFNSKTVFNTFFKKFTGETPKKYWNRIQSKK